MKREERNCGTKIPLSEEIISFMKCYFKKAGKTTAVVGVSGGKDSSVVAALAVMALGPMNVQLVYLPDQFPAVKVNPGTPENDRLFDPDVLKLAECLKVKNGNVWSWSMAHVEGAVHAGAGKLKEAARINLLPRLRTAMLYFHAQQTGSSLVLNTSNLDEKYVGYFTIGGDSGGDWAALQELHASEVVMVGEELGLPQCLTRKTPEDGLSGMTDEQRLGFTYKDVEDFIESLRPRIDGRPYGSVIDAINSFDWFFKDKVSLLKGRVRKEIYQRHVSNLFKWESVKLHGFKKEED